MPCLAGAQSAWPSGGRNGTMHQAVEQAIASMRAHYFDSITLDGLAAEVFVSPFHFSRIFSKATGVTPGQYLTAVRMFEAKRLLLTTSLTVSDIVCSVGYSSVGTFTSRFSRAVGMTPSQYRDPEVGELLVAAAPEFHRLPSPTVVGEAGADSPPAAPNGTGTVTGSVEPPPSAGPSSVLVGLFGEAIPQRGPKAYEYLPDVRASGPAELSGLEVPEGRWTGIAVAERVGEPTEDGVAPVWTARRPISVSAGQTTEVRLRMRALHETD